MISRKRIGYCLLALVFLVVPEATAQNVDRSTRPDIGSAPRFNVPPFRKTALDNGLSIVVSEKPGIPLVQVNLLIHAGSVNDTPGQEGLASMTADMLDEGAGTMDALELSDAFEFLGARFSVSSSLHHTRISLRVPVARLEPALLLLKEVVRNPTFPSTDLDRIRSERITGLISDRDEPGTIASSLFRQVVFGPSHPYGRSTSGTESSLGQFTRAGIVQFYNTFYRPNNATVIVVGGISADNAQRIMEEHFSDWEAGSIPEVSLDAGKQITGRTVYLVDKPGAAQSVIQIGRLGPPRRTNDHFTLQALNTVLGGSFTSRLNQNLREDKGYTYGSSSSFIQYRASGAFVASADVQTAVTGPSLTEFMIELNRIREPIPTDEFNRAKNFLAMRFPIGFQSASDVARKLEEIILFGLPEDYHSQYIEQTLAVDHKSATVAAGRYIDPENMAVIVVGDRSVIEDQIRNLNLGPFRLLTVDDVLGPAPGQKK